MKDFLTSTQRLLENRILKTNRHIWCLVKETASSMWLSPHFLHIRKGVIIQQTLYVPVPVYIFVIIIFIPSPTLS